MTFNQSDVLMTLTRPQYHDVDGFNPVGTPRELLALGVFSGTYFRDAPEDIPDHWDVPQSNFFGVEASKPRSWWIEKNLIRPEDPLGWFQWYLNFHHGRRCDEYDKWQIGRHNAYKARHGAQVKYNGNGDLSKRCKQRQSLLHWAANSIPDITD